jgi:hypothetical protein
MQLYVEYFIIADSSVYDKHRVLLKTTSNTIILQYMKIYFAHLVNSVSETFFFFLFSKNCLFLHAFILIKVNQRYLLSFQNSSDFRICVVLKGLLLETVNLIYNFFIFNSS